MPSQMSVPFSHTFQADDLMVRRTVNLLIKRKAQFACVPKQNYWVISIGDRGYTLLQEEGLISDA